MVTKNKQTNNNNIKHSTLKTSILPLKGAVDGSSVQFVGWDSRHWLQAPPPTLLPVLKICALLHVIITVVANRSVNKR
jgi:hypothetical protein